MPTSFYDQPFLNSPYSLPFRHHALDDDGQLLDLPPVYGRRRSKLIISVSRGKKRVKKAKQACFVLRDAADLLYCGAGVQPHPDHQRNPPPRRALPNPDQWGVTPATKRLLQHWRHHEFSGVRPFFYQVEAAETCIWLAEVARGMKAYAGIWAHVTAAVGPAWRIAAARRDMAGGTAP